MSDFVEINGEKYPLKYGYGSIVLLGEKWGLPGYEEVLSKLASVFPEGGEIKMKFDILEVIGDLILAGITNGGGDVSKADIVDSVIENPEILVRVFEAFRSKLPQEKPGGAKKKTLPRRAKP